MTITTTINGVVTNQTASPAGAIYNTTIDNLPNCATPATSFATGQGPNTELDWVIYDFPGAQPGDVVDITVVSGNNAFTQSSGGMYPASTGFFTIPAPAAPMTPIADVNVCSGEAVPAQQFTGSNITWENTNTNIGLGADGVTEVPAFTAPQVNTTETGTITVSNGCYEEEYDIIVNADPAPQIAITPNSNPAYGGSTQCAYDSILFTSAGTTPAANQIGSYEWDFGDGNTSTNANPSNFYNNPGTYNVELEVTSIYGCVSTHSETYIIYPTPEASFTVDDECVYDAADFINQSTVDNPSNITGYAWDFGDGNTSVDTDPSNLYANHGVYNISLEVVTESGCLHDTVIPVEIFPKPVADFTFINACFNTAIEFTSTSNVASGTIDQYLWDVQSDNYVDYTGSTGQHDYPAAGFYDITHYAITDFGCSDTITQEIVVYPLPEAVWDVDEVCFEDASEFVDNSTVQDVDGDVITNWEWSFGNGNTSTAQNPTITYGGENIYDVELVVTTNYGCTDTLTQTATVWPLPSVDFSPTDVCLEFDTEFFDESTISNTYTNNNLVGWTWDFGDGNGSNVQNPVHSYSNDGTFYANLEVTSSNGCVNDTTLEVTVHPKPEASFTGVELNGCAPICPEITSTSVVNAPSNIVNYEWRLSDGTIVDGASPVFGDCFDNETGNSIFYGLELEVTTNEGCKDVHNEPNYIEVYHNPIANFFYLPENPDVIDPIVTYTNTSSYADFYNWSFTGIGNSTDVNPVIEYPAEPEDYEIELIAITNEGCTDTAWATVEILDRIIFYVPNTFTPDNDNFNETFQPVFTHGFDPGDFNLLIFNRWGDIVFESNDASIGWDGTYGAESNRIVRDGTYVWKIEFKETMSDKRHTHTGHVNVLK